MKQPRAEGHRRGVNYPGPIGTMTETWVHSNENATSPATSGVIHPDFGTNTVIFGAHASRHWAAGLPVIPIAPGQKRPLLPGWQRFADRLPDAEEQLLWIEGYPNHNMGLPLG